MTSSNDQINDRFSPLPPLMDQYKLPFYLSRDRNITNAIMRSKYSLINVNIQSLNGHFDMLHSVIKDIKVDILVLSEIWNAVPEYSKMSGYHTPHFYTRSKGSGGGTGIYIRENMTILENPPILKEIKCKNLEICICTVEIHSKPVHVIAMYRAPNTSNFKTSMKDLEKILSALTILGNQFIISGDMNIDVSKDTSYSDQYLNIIQNFHSRQIVSSATRVTSHSSTCIDHIITNISDMGSIVTDFCPADHQAVLATWVKKVPKKEKKIKKNLAKTTTVDIDKSAENIKLIDWTDFSDLCSDPNISIHNLYSYLESLISKCIVMKEHKYVSKIKNPWMTIELLTERNQVHSLRSRFLKSKTPYLEDRFRVAKANYNEHLKHEKNKYYKNLLVRAGTSGKKIWKVINEVLDRKKFKNEFTEKIVYQNNELTNEKTISDGFNLHFKNVAFDIAKSIKPKKHFLEFLNHTSDTVNEFSFKKVTENDILEIIKGLKSKKSSGYDSLSSRLVKATSSCLSPALTKLINKSFEQNEFPQGLKLGKLQPLHKKGCVTDPNNFRPISQLSIISNITEKVAINQWNNHSKSNNIDYNCQFGFKKQHSCSHALMITRDYIERERAKNNYIILISTDQSKAFDTLNSETILPAKLAKYGMSNDSIHWIKSFFSEREQFVKWKDTQSDTIKLHNISCVQGSSMGPCIFNIYINDLHSCTEFFCVQFADDSNFLMSGPNLEELLEKANSEIIKVLDYMDSNFLSVNIKKCNFMIFKPKVRAPPTNHILKIRDTEIVESEYMKFLGIWLDNKLAFKKQINYVMSKMKSAIGALIKTKHTLTYRSKMCLYNGLVKPHLDYCCLVWLDKANKGQFNQLYVLQKRAIRLCFKASYNTHSAQLFRISNSIPLEDLYVRESVIFIKKHQNSELPSSLSDKLGKFSTNVRTNQMYSMKIPSAYKCGHMFYNIISAWNKSNHELRIPSKTDKTKDALKELTLEKLNLRKCEVKKCHMCIRDISRDFVKYTKS